MTDFQSSSPLAPPPSASQREGGGEASEFGFSPEWLIQVLRRRLWTSVGIFVGVAIAGFWFFLSSPAQYSVQVKLKIEEKQKVFNIEEFLSFEKITPDFYHTQVRLIQSRQLIRRVVEQLDLFHSTEFSRLVPSTLHYRIASLPSGAPRTATASVVDPEFERAMSRVVDQYERQLIVLSDRQTPQIVYLNFYASDPVLAAHIANTHAQLYIDYSKQTNSLFTDEFIEGLKRQLTYLDNQVQQQDTGILQFKKDNGFFQLQGVSSYDPIQDIDDRLSRVRTQLAVASDEVNRASATYHACFFDGKTTDLNEINVDVLHSQTLDHLRERKTEILEEWTKIVDRYGEAHHNYIKTKNQLDVIELAIQSEILSLVERAKSDYETAESRYDLLMGQEQNLIREKYSRDAQWSTLQDLVRTRDQMVEQKTSVVTDLQNAQGSLETLKDSPSRIFVIVDPAEIPLKATNRNYLRMILLTFSAAFGAALLGALLLELQDRTIRTPTQLEQLTGISVLGCIPHFVLEDQLAVEGRIDASSSSPAAEAFIALRTRFLFSDLFERSRCLLVTSPLASEGKSTVVVNLASAMALIGKRSVILDADLRNPSLHDFFGLPASPGLSNIITGVETLDNVLSETDLPDLYAVPAGTAHPRPSEILTSASFKDLVNHLREQFDYIFVDVGPVLVTPDPTILSPQVDMTLLVVRCGSSTEEDVVSALDHIQRAGGSVFSTILNDVPSSERGVYWKYGYGYAAKSSGNAVVET